MPKLIPAAPTVGRPTGLAAHRSASADGFLASRGLDRAALAGLVEQKVGPSRSLLLTSSAVQGLANPTSDLDLIRVADTDPGPHQMAVQLFEAGQHLEVVSFGRRETAAALADLGVLAGQPAAAVLAGHRGWDRGRTVRRKYLERLVNGVDMDGGSPYLEHLPALARVWRCASLHQAAEQVLFLRLAEAAGESRGRLGYAIGALLHLMDATLCACGDVYSNRKWYLMRWRRLRAGLGPAGPMPPGDGISGLADRIDATGGLLTAALAAGPGDSPGELAGPFTDLLERAFAVVGEGRPAALVIEPVGSPRLPFLPGADLLLGTAGIFLGPGGLPSGTLDLSTGSEPPAAPGNLLRALRAGALRLDPA